MTRLEAIRKIRKGETIEVLFTPEEHGVSSSFMVSVHYLDICNFSRHKRRGHETIGPIHCLFFSGAPFWIHITPKQLLGFIRRNYLR